MEWLNDVMANVFGFATEDKIIKIHELVKETCETFENPLSVETGVFDGKSFIPMAYTHKELNKGSCFGIDTWEKEAAVEGAIHEKDAAYWSWLYWDQWYRHFMVYVLNHNLESHCRWLKERSDVAVNLFKDESITLFHCDSNHSEVYSLKEVKLYLPKVVKGGYIILDDFEWPTIAKAKEFLENNCEIIYEKNGENCYAVYKKN